ncbi:MAG TPA: glycosyltransferase family A protein [Pyrinomonadaceae bacterium]|jgi:glycosyltransferase involved in cell wall biosynthesis|nr:glycosyltransferase family A protein [Pyrinomonadaceae bacterium]
MLISVVIPAWNAAEYLREAIRSVLAQGHRPIEIVVVDDGSTDHTRQVCESFGAQVRYIFQENDGTKGGGARARGIREARGELIALLDQDDRWLPTKIERQLAALEAHPGAGIVFTRARTIDGAGRLTDAREDLPGGAVSMSAREAFHLLLTENPFCPSSALVRREVVGALLSTDPRTVGCGDWELWFSVAREHPVVVLDEALTDYRVSAEQFCANKDQLASSMLLTLRQQRSRFHEGCAECERSYRAGLWHVSDVFAVAARNYLDDYHAAARGGRPLGALRSLRLALRAAPREVMRPRRVLAVCKNFASSTVTATKRLIHAGAHR